MLTENIAKDHESTMMIDTVKIAMEAVEKITKKEGHLLKDVKKEGTYADNLTLGEGPLTEECFIEDDQSFDTDRNMEKYFSEDKISHRWGHYTV